MSGPIHATVLSRSLSLNPLPLSLSLSLSLSVYVYIYIYSYICVYIYICTSKSLDAGLGLKCGSAWHTSKPWSFVGAIVKTPKGVKCEMIWGSILWVLKGGY